MARHARGTPTPSSLHHPGRSPGASGGATLSAELLEQSREHDLLPLRWAASMLLTALEPGSDAVEAELRAVTALLARRGRVLG